MTTAAAAPPAPEVDYSDEDSLKWVETFRVLIGRPAPTALLFFFSSSKIKASA